MFNFESFAQIMGQWLDMVGVVIIVGGMALSSLMLAVAAMRRGGVHHLYQHYRQNLSRSILIGLEFMVAGDIIRTVAGDLTYDGILVLAGIVAIRLVLGMSLEMEIDGRWPWRRAKSGARS